ncbi:LIRA3 protein, partial [Amia calva]|nr:LIRA3 protein [Amia calva]
MTGDTLSITAVSVSDGGQYQCEGQRAGSLLSSHRSDPVSLSVSGNRPKPNLSLSRASVFTGDSVTLRCEVEGGSAAGWRYYCYRDSQSKTTLVSPTESSTGALRSSYTIDPVSLSHSGLYWCVAGRGDAPYYTQYSVAVTLTVSGE